MQKVDIIPGGCWEWRAQKANGYGRFRLGDKQRAHCISYEHNVGPIPEGMELDHTCHNRGCVNPEHLEALTHVEHMRRPRNLAAYRVTHCPYGHALEGDNLVKSQLPKRNCRFCTNERARSARSKQNVL